MEYLNLCLLSTAILVNGCGEASNALNNNVNEGSSTQDDSIQKDVIIGDLGGVPVDIPRDWIRLVEYNGDPDWGESFRGDSPERNYQSNISSFGFDVRYTDGAVYDGIVGKYADEYEAQKNLADSPWMSVGVNSGDRYYGPGGIDRIGKGTINAIPNRHPTSIYAKLPKPQYGLDVYAPPGVDLKTNKPWRKNEDAEDVFIKRNKDGEITTYIQCSNRDVEHPPCTHYFDLEPKMGLDVYFSYSRYVLQDWQQIEQVVREVVLGFRK